MSFLKSLHTIVRFLGEAIKFLKHVRLEKNKADLKDAKDEAIESKDQRPLEEALGGGGKPSSRKYDGMYTRPKKKRP